MRKVSMYSMVLLYVLAGINHFIHPQFYIRLIPDYFPLPAVCNYVAAVAEITLCLMLCFSQTRKAGSLGLALLLVLFFLVHIDMLEKSLRFQRGAVPAYLAIGRLLLQPFLIGWALFYYKS